MGHVQGSGSLKSITNAPAKLRRIEMAAHASQGRGSGQRMDIGDSGLGVGQVEPGRGNADLSDEFAGRMLLEIRLAHAAGEFGFVVENCDGIDQEALPSPLRGHQASFRQQDTRGFSRTRSRGRLAWERPKTARPIRQGGGKFPAAGWIVLLFERANGVGQADWPMARSRKKTGKQAGKPFAEAGLPGHALQARQKSGHPVSEITRSKSTLAVLGWNRLSGLPVLEPGQVDFRPGRDESVMTQRVESLCDHGAVVAQPPRELGAAGIK